MYTIYADQSGRVVQGLGLRPPACWDCEFESLQGHDVSVVSVVSYKFLRRANSSSRGVLLIVPSDLETSTAAPYARIGLLRHKTRT